VPAAWPTVEGVKQVLGISTAARDAVVSAATAAAIEQVAADLGYLEVEVTEAAGLFSLAAVAPTDAATAAEAGEEPTPAAVDPSWSTSQAALILAVQVLKAPEAPYGVAAVFDTGGLRVAAEHPTYQQMLLGERLAFGVG
jgi:hypothetical protein